MPRFLVHAAAFLVVLVATLIAGTAVAAGMALLGHEVLVRVYGTDLSAIDDTVPMQLAVVSAYLAGIAAGVAVMVIGWRRLVRRTAKRDEPG